MTKNVVRAEFSFCSLSRQSWAFIYRGDNLYTCCHRTNQRGASLLPSRASETRAQRFRAPNPSHPGSRCIDRIRNQRLSLAYLLHFTRISALLGPRKKMLHSTKCHCSWRDQSYKLEFWISSVKIRKSQHHYGED